MRRVLRRVVTWGGVVLLVLALVAVLQGYADGINFYAALHPEQVVPGFQPLRADDIAAGFVFFTPLFLAERTKPVLLDPAALRPQVRREYRPGRSATAIAATALAAD